MTTTKLPLTTALIAAAMPLHRKHSTDYGVDAVGRHYYTGPLPLGGHETVLDHASEAVSVTIRTNEAGRDRITFATPWHVVSRAEAERLLSELRLPEVAARTGALNQCLKSIARSANA